MKGYCKHSKKLESSDGVYMEEWFHLPEDHDLGSTCKDAVRARENFAYPRSYGWHKDGKPIPTEGDHVWCNHD